MRCKCKFNIHFQEIHEKIDSNILVIRLGIFGWNEKMY